MDSYTVEFLDRVPQSGGKTIDAKNDRKAVQRVIKQEIEDGRFARAELKQMDFKVKNTADRNAEPQIYSYGEVM